MVTEVTDAPPDVKAKLGPVEAAHSGLAVEVELSVTVVAVADVVAAPKAFSWVTVIGPRVALLEVVPDTADVKTNFAGGALAIVTLTPDVAETLEFESSAVMEY